MAFGIDDALLAGTVGIATGATNGIFGLFGGKETQESSKELAKLQQYYAVQNAYLAHQFELENLGITGCQQRKLQESAYQYDKGLARYNRELQKMSADEDYNRSIKYIADAQRAYKNALQKNGYNPLLALSSSIPSYLGRTNSAVGGSVGAGGAVSASTSAAPHAASAGTGPDYHLGMAASSGIQSALDFARVLNEVKTRESDIERNKTESALNLERAKTEVEKRATEIEQRTPTTKRINAETTKGYSGAAKDIITGVSSGVAGYEMAKHGPRVAQLMKSAVQSGSTKKVLDLLPKATQPVLKESNSAFLGSRALQVALPLIFGASAAGLGAAGKASADRLNSRNRRLTISPSGKYVPSF